MSAQSSPRSLRMVLACAMAFAVFFAFLAMYAPGRAFAGRNDFVRTQPPAAVAVTDTVRTFLPLLAVPPLRAQTVVAGWGHACALGVDRAVRCWGAEFGVAPEPMPGLTDVTQISAAGYVWSERHGLSGTVVRTCAVTGAGALLCWRDLPSVRQHGYEIVLTSGAAAVATGGIHACVLMQDGGIQCWGSNSYGELGDGTTNTHATPVPVAGLRGSAVAVTAGIVQCYGCVPYMTGTYGHSCALLADGRVQCWGDNREGQLGNGKTGDGQYSLTPIVVDLKGKAVALDTNGVETCALLTNNQVKCWGGAIFGPKPKSVAGNPGPLAALADGCGLDSAGGLWCWADGVAAKRTDGPLQATSYARGLAECVTDLNGGVYCNGYNGQGMLGNGQGGLARPDPVPVYGLSGPVSHVTAGAAFACAVTEGQGAINCWGKNGQGQLGDGSLVDKTVPTSTAGDLIAQEVDLGQAHGCARTLTGVFCWGANDRQQVAATEITSSTTPLPVAGLGPEVVAIAVGGRHNCALLSGGAVQCWGDNGLGQAGGVTAVQSNPLTVTGLGGPAQLVVAGDEHTCAVLTTGVVQCWGGNQYAELGLGTTSISVTLPITVVGLPVDVVRLAAGAHHTCALAVGGQVRCWGAVGGRYVEAWEPVKVQATPGEVVGLIGVTDLFAGGTLYRYYPPFNGAPPPLTTLIDSRTCTNADGVLVCWQVGQTAAPEPLAGFETGAISVGVGGEFACGVAPNDSVRCWGKNDAGQLGNASPWSPFWVRVNGY